MLFPSENLLEVVQTLLNDRFTNYESPAIIYTRMEIIGKDQLQQKTLKDIGLVGGKALLRFVWNFIITSQPLLICIFTLKTAQLPTK